MGSTMACGRRWLGAGVFTLLAACGSDGDDSGDAATQDAAGQRPADAAIEPTNDGGLDAGTSALDARVPASSDASSDSGDARVEPPGDGGVPGSCPVPAPTSCPDPTALRYQNVAPIIEARCASCHSPLWSGPWPLHTLAHVRDWLDDIRTNLVACTMPPADAGVPMTRDERLLILQWIRCGAPE